MVRRNLWRATQAIIIAMRHDDAANHAGGNTPAGGMGELLIALFVLIFDPRRLGKTRAQIMRRSGLQGFPILHHRFDAVGCYCTRKTLILRLFASHNGHRQRTFSKGTVHFERAHRFLHGICAVGMGGMPFLPQKLACAQEHTRAHFPADNIGPLVHHQRQITPALNPAAHGCANHRFRCWANDKWFFQL